MGITKITLRFENNERGFMEWRHMTEKLNELLKSGHRFTMYDDKVHRAKVRKFRPNGKFVGMKHEKIWHDIRLEYAERDDELIRVIS